MRLIDADALMEYLLEKLAMYDSVDTKRGLVPLTIRNDLQGFVEMLNEQPTIDAISMREWNLLRNSIKELQENNPEKKDVQFTTKFLLRLMDISERRDKNGHDNS